jgi:OmpW family
MMQTRFSLLTLAATLVMSGPVLAQKAGSWSATVGVTQLSPQVTSGDLSAPSLPGTKSGVSSDTEPTGSISYMVNDNVAVNVPLGLGFKHNITGAGPADHPARAIPFYGGGCPVSPLCGCRSDLCQVLRHQRHCQPDGHLQSWRPSNHHEYPIEMGANFSARGDR